MARKKKDSGGGVKSEWINTFADLMNLLLCFFIMIFAFSTIDGEKFEKLSISMSNSFGVFKGGGVSIGNGPLVSSGMTQMTELSKYLSKMAENSHKSDAENENDDNQKGNINSEDSQNPQGSKNNENVNLEEAMDKIEEEMSEVTSGMYDEVADLTEQYNLGDYVELSMDSKYQFVQLTLKGSVLFDSGAADIKEVAKPILSRIGDILNQFEGYHIEITGHTDNVPMNDSSFKDNNWLSSARALNAAEYLINVSGIDPGILKYSGRGEYEPISSNTTAEGRANNRRIEIKLYNNIASDMQ